MKHKKLAYFGIAILAFCVLSFAWMMAEPADHERPQKEIAAKNNEIPTAAGSVVKQPTTTTASSIAPPAQVAAPTVATPSPATGGIVMPPAANAPMTEKTEEKTPALTAEEIAKIRGELKQSVETKFNDKLSFPLNEAKMIAYAQASMKVKKLNNKWDVQIAGADTDKTAIEYNNLAVEEISKSLQSMKDLSLEQYNEMTKLTATDQEFNRVYQVYKQMIQEGMIAVNTTPTIAAPIITTPTVSAPATTMPVAAPAVPGTVPAPQGSPAPPYSQQPSR